MDNCTRCDKKLDNMRIHIQMNMITDRMKDTGVWESIPNMNLQSQEILCEDCFAEFNNIMNSMNIKHKDK